MSSHFADLPILDELGRDLERAWSAAEASPSRRSPRIRRRSVPSLVFAALVLLALAAGAAAATLLALRGSVIPGPAKEDLQPPMIVRPGSAHMAGITARDPSADRVWSVRLATSETGLVCTTAGELRDGHFGVTGLDGRFRVLAPEFVDGCGKPRTDRAAVIEARVFDAPRRADVRTVIVGYAGSGLRRAELQTASGTRRLPSSREGAFVAVVTRYPEDTGFRVRLTFADGSHATQTFGRDQFVAPDPSGALRTESFVVSNHPRDRCVNLTSARQAGPFVRGPTLCGKASGSDYFFDARTVKPGDRSRREGLFGWNWQTHPARTIVWGLAGSRVKRITVITPNGRLSVRRELSGAFVALLPPSVDPRTVEVAVRISNGRTEQHRVPYRLGPVPPR